MASTRVRATNVMASTGTLESCSTLARLHRLRLKMLSVLELGRLHLNQLGFALLLHALSFQAGATDHGPKTLLDLALERFARTAGGGRGAARSRTSVGASTSAGVVVTSEVVLTGGIVVAACGNSAGAMVAHAGRLMDAAGGVVVVATVESTGAMMSTSVIMCTSQL